MKRSKEAERTNGQGRSASKTVTLGHAKSDTKTELRSESSKGEAARDLEWAKGEFASSLEFAQILWRKYPDLVEADVLEEPLAVGIPKEHNEEPYYQRHIGGEDELVAAGILPKRVKLRLRFSANNMSRDEFKDVKAYIARKRGLVDAIQLETGMHCHDDGVCAMELAARLAGDLDVNYPKCVSPVLATFLRIWNDSFDDTSRQTLKPFIPRVIDTANDGKDEIRAWMATDWLVRICAPAWLDLAQLTKHARRLRRAERIINEDTAFLAESKVSAAKAASWAAYRLGGGIRDTGHAAKAAAVAANRPVRTIAGAAYAVALAAAGIAVGNEADSQPTIKVLQASAFKLFDRMIIGEASDAK